jgi:hypothetical protein
MLYVSLITLISFSALHIVTPDKVSNILMNTRYPVLYKGLVKDWPSLADFVSEFGKFKVKVQH